MCTFAKNFDDMNRIKEVLSEEGILLNDVAERLGVSRQALSRQINCNMLLDTAERIADAINVPIWRFFATDEEVVTDIRKRGKIEEYCPHCGERIDV